MERPAGPVPTRDEAVLWLLGQAGCLIESSGVTVAIDPYLSDSAARNAPDFTRLIPPPIAPDKLEVDMFVITHDHMDHLDPETVGPYRHKETTLFVAPRLACATLGELGVPERNIVRVDAGEERILKGVAVRGAYAIPTEAKVLDTCGYRLEFPNHRSLYHSSDTSFSELLLKAAPHAEVLLVCINGKWGNLGVPDAVRLAMAVKPRVAIPNHYDMMRPNTEDPEEFVRHLNAQAPNIPARILHVLEPLVW